MVVGPARVMDFRSRQRLTTLSDGRIVVVWASSDGGAAGSEIHSQIIDPRDGLIIGTSSAEQLYGNAIVDDEISGFGGNDSLNGLVGDDALYGGGGQDKLVGEKGGGCVRRRGQG